MQATTTTKRPRPRGPINGDGRPAGTAAARTRGAGWASRLGLGALLLGTTLAAPAVTLWDNGVVGLGTSFCASNNCGNGFDGPATDWTYLDNFVVAGNARLTSLEFFDAASPTGSDLASVYRSTNWSIRTGDPFGPSIAGGNAIASVLDVGANRFRFSLDGLDVTLDAGVTYWLGTNNQFDCNAELHPLGFFIVCEGYASIAVGLGVGSAPGFPVGLPGGAAQVNGEGVQFTDRPERAFRLFGGFLAIAPTSNDPNAGDPDAGDPSTGDGAVTLPEPAGLGLLGLGLLGLSFARSLRGERGDRARLA